MNRQYPLALRSAEEAEAGLPYGSADWIRAGDIAHEARALMEQACASDKRACEGRKRR